MKPTTSRIIGKQIFKTKFGFVSLVRIDFYTEVQRLHTLQNLIWDSNFLTQE